MKKQVDAETVIEAAIIAFGAALAALLFRAWGLMVIIGVVHAELLSSVNAAGFGTAITLAVLWNLVNLRVSAK